MVIRKVCEKNLSEALSIRLEMLREVNGLSEGYEFDGDFISETEKYLKNPCQTTVLAFEDGALAGCATICYTYLLPTFSHPTGKRAHIMNVYTRAQFRRRKIAENMMERLISEAREKGVTEISLDATVSGRPLYESLGFTQNAEGMALVLNHY